MSEPLMQLTDVGVRAIEMKRRKRRSNVPTLLGARVKQRGWPIRHLDLTMAPGETLFVTDVSGSRPAVFFRMVCGMIPIDEGTARLPPRTVLSRAPSGKLMRNLSVGQALRLLCGLHGMPDKGIDRRFDEMVDFAEAAGQLHLTVEAAPRQLVQQVNFTTSVFVPADLYTFDGDAFVGSAAFRQKCGMQLRDMAARGKGIMIHSASARQATDYGDRGLVLNGEQSQDVPIERFAQLLADRTLLRSEMKRKKKQKRRREGE